MRKLKKLKKILTSGAVNQEERDKFLTKERENTKSFYRHIFYVTIDLSQFFENYSEKTMHTMPIEFSGRIKFIDDDFTTRGSIQGAFEIRVPRAFQHARGLFKEIGVLKFREFFIKELWGDSLMQDQLRILSKIQKYEFDQTFVDQISRSSYYTKPIVLREL